MPYAIALDELMHHGILGMKWGKRNGPPYPLEYKKLSPEEKAQAKSKAIREGNVKEAAANINEFTNDELRQLRDRFNLNQDIAKINASTKKTGAQKVDKAIDWINRGVRAADAGSKAYNAFAKISNALNPDEDSQLPLIGEKKQPKNKAEGKTKQQMLDMVKSGKLSTKDYKDISERMEAIDKTESFFKPKKKITEKDFYEMIEHPDRYTAEETKEGWEKFKVVNAAKASKGYENYKEERDFYGFYHGLVEEIEHSAKGTTWSKKDAKYISKEKTSGGKVRYKYAQNKKEIDKNKAEADALRDDGRDLRQAAGWYENDADVYDSIAKDSQAYLDDPSKAVKRTYKLSNGDTIKIVYPAAKSKDKIPAKAKTYAKNSISKSKTKKTASQKQAAKLNSQADEKFSAANKKMKTVTKLSKENAKMIHDSWWHKFKKGVKTNSRKAKRWVDDAITWLTA